jgi:hypothetical protein
MLPSRFFSLSWSPRCLGRLSLGALALFAVTLTSSSSQADRLLIKQPGAHPDYTFEVEPHLVLGFADPPGGKFEGRGKGFGPGFRGTIELVDNGFIQSINNTVGIGFGADLLMAGGKGTTLVLPVVMQWNFWLSENWSVFGEPGGAIYLGDKSGVGPVFMAGGRLHFSDAIALTLRVGYPSLAVGLSFLL